MIVHAEPAEWWQIVAALTPLMVLLGITAVVVWYGLRRPDPDSVAGAKTRADSWARTKWALDMALDDKPERRNLGLTVLDHLSTSPKMSREDVQIVAQAKALLKRA